MNEEQPEAILIAGDIIDGSIRALIDQDMATEFRRLKAPVYACLGNHEYLSGEPRAKKFYQDAGIHLLIDNHSVVPLAGGDSILIVGRDDRTNKKACQSTAFDEVCSKGLIIRILMDHQALSFGRGTANWYRLPISGHTHYGQVVACKLDRRPYL